MTGIPAAPPSSYAVRAAGIRVEFDRTVAVDDIDLTICQGEFVAVMGPSGSGKSTLLYCLAGLESPTAGSVYLAGREITGLSLSARAELRRDHISFVFQQYNLLPFLNVRDNVALPGRMAHRPVPATQVDRILAEVGLDGFARTMPAQLSGGEQQRVAIARALAGTQRVVLADEPTGALDTRSAQNVLTLLARIPRSGRSVVMVTHDPVAAAHADRVVYLSNGRIVDTAGGEDAARIAARMIALTPRSAA